jgi:arabinogalactan endo-1,4-beta-galactosidase
MRLSFCIGGLVFGLLAIQACSEDRGGQLVPNSKEELIRAVDVSFLPTIRKEGTVFFNTQQQAGDALDILKAAGCNTVRLRLWHTPISSSSSLQEVQAFASEIRDKGFKLWIVVHYSDTWADPGNQEKPAAWGNASVPVLGDSVYTYTKRIVRLLNPEFIQLGNEVNGGMLWPEGRISNPSNFALFLKKGAAAVRESNANTKIMIHHAGTEADAFYATLKSQQIDYDIIALSYYPRWHTKSLTEVSDALERLGTANDKDIMLAETAYPFTLEWNDYTNNLVGEASHLLSNYPASPTGQKNFLLTIRSMIELNPRGIGFAYWEPEWVAYRGTEASDGSPWENMALFDFNRQALPGLEAFKE